MMYRIVFVFSFIALILANLTVPAAAEHRVALVIGNGKYQHADKLSNPVTDARNLRDVLVKLHFDVTYGEDLDKRDLERTIGRFAGAAQDAEVALVYFAGHGATFGDIPYIVPVDAEFTSLEAVPYDLVPVEALVGELRRAKGVRIVILDACRDNAAERELKRTASRGGEVSRGLARIKNPEGLILAYATQYLDTAADGDPNGDSPFTSALLKNIATPGLDVKDLFFQVGRDVMAKTNGHQRPEISISFYEPFTLVPSTAASPRTLVVEPATPPKATTADATLWSLIKARDDPRLFRDFVRQFPESEFVSQANRRIAEIDDAAWSRVRSSPDEAGVRAYLAQFPAGAHSPQARARLAALEAKPGGKKKPVASRPVQPARATEQAQRALHVAPRPALIEEDATTASLAVYPPHTLKFGATVQLTSRSGRRMTCVGGSGDAVPRRCTWD